MIYFLFGPDTYRSRHKLKEIIEEYKKTNPDWLDFNKIDVRNSEINILNELKHIVKTVSMFGNKKLIIVENIFLTNEWLQKKILEFFKKRNLEKDRDIIIFFWAEEIKPESVFFKFLKSKAKFQEFNYLKGFQLKNWIRDYILRHNGKIENLALDKLIEYIGSDLWRMTNEINKLISFKLQVPSSKSQTIEIKDVELLVKPEIDINIFNIIDALGQKNKKQTLKLIHNYFKKGESEMYLLDRFVYQFRNLIKIKAGGGRDLHPFVAKKTNQQAKNFTFEELKKIYRKLLEIDLSIKTGKIDVRTALELFVINL